MQREHAVVEDGVRNGKTMGLRNLPPKGLDGEPRLGSWPEAPLTWPHGPGSSACMAATPAKDAEPDTLRGSGTFLTPALSQRWAPDPSAVTLLGLPEGGRRGGTVGRDGWDWWGPQQHTGRAGLPPLDQRTTAGYR